MNEKPHARALAVLHTERLSLGNRIECQLRECERADLEHEDQQKKLKQMKKEMDELVNSIKLLEG